MTIIHKKQTILVNTKGGTVSQNGSHLDITLGENSLKFPKLAKNLTMSVSEGFIVNSVPNIITGDNDTLVLTTGGLSYNIVIAEGVYSGNTIGTALEIALAAQGLATDVITLTANTDINRMVLGFNSAGSVDFNTTNSIGPILGFGTNVYTSTSIPENITAPNQATLNRYNYFLVHSDLVNSGILINESFNQTAAVVPVDVNTYQQIHYQPRNPQKHTIENLHGTPKNHLAFWITDQYNNPIVFPDDWTLVIQFEWDEFIVV
jgi:hypothetical protein